MSKRKIAGLVLILLLAFASAAGAAGVSDAYRPVASNDAWTLYLREDTLGLLMRDNITGATIESTVPNPDDFGDNTLWKGFYQSGITVEYIEANINKYPWANLVYTEHELAYTYFQNGFTCEVYYGALGLRYQVTVTLEGNVLTVRIPQDKMTEERPEEFCFGSFYVYPFMGYSYLGQNGGFMLIPDGQGALVELKDNEGRYLNPYTATVYGRNVGLTEVASGAVLNNRVTGSAVEAARMPVFGMVHADEQIGFLSIIEEGDISASIQAYFNGVSKMVFDWVGAKYTYRVVYAQATGPSSGTVNMRTPRAKRFDITQRFCFVSGADADYTGLAKQYRAYLTERGVFARAGDTADFDVQVNFFGADRESGLIGTVPVTMTTARQAEDILAALSDRGVRDVTSVFYGWQKYGQTGGRPVTGYTPAGNLGGAEGFAALYKAARELGVSLYLDADVATMVPATAGTLKYAALKKVDSNTFSLPIYGWIYSEFQYLSPVKTLELAKSVAGAFEAREVPGVSLSGLTRLVTDFKYRQTYYDSGECADLYSQSAAAFASGMPVLLSEANAYLWQYAGALTDMPIAGSDYMFTAQEVPFMAIALSGQIPLYTEYVNFQANTKRYFLNLVEQGARPAFLITAEDPIKLQNTDADNIYSSQFSLYEDLIVEWYEKLSELHALIGSAAIDSHVRQGDLVTVTYDNGLTIYCNYGSEAVIVNGTYAIAPNGYKAVINDGD